MVACNHVVTYGTVPRADPHELVENLVEKNYFLLGFDQVFDCTLDRI